MHNTFSAILGLIVPLFLAATIATAAPPAKAAEYRYIAARDAAIEKISAIYDAGKADEAARKAEEAATADLAARMRAILNEAARDGFGPHRLHIDTFNKGDEGFGMLDGLRFEAVVGKNGEKAARSAPTGRREGREVCRSEGAYHRHDANAVRTMAARPQGVVG